MKYIPADKLIAEIERLLKCTELHRGDAVADGSRQTLYWIKDFITSLQQEQTEVDFEKEWKSYMEFRKDDLSGNAVTVNMKDLARHFWNKGYNARKEE